MKLYLVRHGQRGVGKLQDTLTEIGEEQSRRTAQFFKDKKINAFGGLSLEILKPILKQKTTHENHPKKTQKRPL